MNIQIVKKPNGDFVYKSFYRGSWYGDVVKTDPNKPTLTKAIVKAIAEKRLTRDFSIIDKHL